MTAKIDHEAAAFFAAMLCFWTICAISRRWIPQLGVFWEDRAAGVRPFEPWNPRTVGFVWLGWGVLFGMSFFRIHWTTADTYKTLIWLVVSASVALIGMVTAKVWSRSIRLMKSAKEKTH